jgi:hypothetical protein
VDALADGADVAEEITQVLLHAEGKDIVDGAIGQMGVEYGGQAPGRLTGVALDLARISSISSRQARRERGTSLRRISSSAMEAWESVL